MAKLERKAGVLRGPPTKIEYVGEFAVGAPPKRSEPVADPGPVMVLPATQTASEVRAAPQIDVPPTESKAASMPNTSTVENGLKGLK